MTPIEVTSAVIAAILSFVSPDWNTQDLIKNRADIQCLAKVVYHEMRSESAECQIMVAYTALDRYAMSDGNLSLCDVVKKPRQFAPKVRKSGTINEPKAWDQSVEIALLTYTGAIDRPEHSQGAPLHFHGVNQTPVWAASMRRVAVKCNHAWLVSKR